MLPSSGKICEFVQYNEVPRDWQNVFAITRFCYIEVLFHIFYYYWGKEIVRYTEDFAI